MLWVKRFDRIIVINIVVWPILATILFLSFVYSNYQIDRGFWYYVYTFCVWTQILFDLLSCYILVTAFKRLRQVCSTIKMAVNSHVMLLHIISYALFLLSGVFYLLSIISSNRDYLSIMSCVIALTVFSSELILAHIFLSISSTEKKRRQSKSSAHLSYNSTVADDSQASSDGELSELSGPTNYQFLFNRSGGILENGGQILFLVLSEKSTFSSLSS